MTNRIPPQSSPASTLAEDLIYGVDAIADFIGEKAKRTYLLLERKQLPGGKVAGKWVASRRALSAYFAKLTGAERA